MGLSIDAVMIFNFIIHFCVFLFFGGRSDIELGSDKRGHTEGGIKTSKKSCDVIYGQPLLKKLHS